MMVLRAIIHILSSSCPEAFREKSVLKNISHEKKNSHENTFVGISFSQVFSWKFWKTFKTTFFIEHLR